MLRSFSLVILALSTVFAASASSRLIEAPVQLDTGLVAGKTIGVARDVKAFLGIPYAAPPVGDLRWRPPQAVAPWEGIRQTVDFSQGCQQRPMPRGHFYEGLGAKNLSEDCLYLNVWTAAASTAERRPVMVWIHGGSLTLGHAGTDIYDGSELARQGIVVVSINYRLNAFGFLAHPALTAESEHGSSGQYAILDQVAALKWVQRNIAGFGGDSNRVTIFGESAGSRSVCFLMATPLAKGLFHRAIGHSSSPFGPMRRLSESSPEQESAESIGERFFHTLGAEQSAEGLAAMRRKSPEELLASTEVTGSRNPSVDGWVFPDEVRHIFAAGQHNRVPLIVGSNANESRSFSTQQSWTGRASLEAYQQHAVAEHGEFSDEFLKAYPAGNDEEARVSWFQSVTHRRWTSGIRTWVRESARFEPAAYLYLFTRVPPGPWAEKYKAYHAAEIPYVFGTLRPWLGRPDAPALARHPYDRTDHELSSAMTRYWVNFAHTGDPNGDGLPQWPRYSRSTDESLEFGDVIRTVRNYAKRQLDFWDAFDSRP